MLARAVHLYHLFDTYYKYQMHKRQERISNNSEYSTFLNGLPFII